MKILFVVVMGLLAAVLAPISSQTGGPSLTLPIANLAASRGIGQPAANANHTRSTGGHWHRLPGRLPRPPRRGGPSPSPSASANPSPSASPSAAPSAAPPPGPAMDCSILAPADPLSARGLATPWELTDDGAGPCHESNPDQAAFVEAAVLDPVSGQVSVYDPLVIDRGSKPAIAPAAPALPNGAIVGIWLGFNGNNLAVRGTGSASCVSGTPTSDFGQNAFCNAPAFFAAANAAIRAGKLVVPALGMAKDGLPCPTTRDFSIVDQDQSDNTTTKYLVTADGRLAQNTPANLAKLSGAKVATNGSDEGLLDRAVDNALGCTPWTVPDLADATHQQQVTAWPLNELMASVRQAPPVALIPAGDPFVFDGDQPSLAKLDLYRAGVGQPLVGSLAQASTTTYCRNLLTTGLPRIAADRQFTGPLASPFPGDASDLFNFLAFRFNSTFSNGDGFLHCEQLLGMSNPVTLKTNADGVVVDATINLKPGPPAASPSPSGGTAR